MTFLGPDDSTTEAQIVSIEKRVPHESSLPNLELLVRIPKGYKLAKGRLSKPGDLFLNFSTFLWESLEPGTELWEYGLKIRRKDSN